jgi:hypothetical protein
MTTGRDDMLLKRINSVLERHGGRRLGLGVMMKTKKGCLQSVFGLEQANFCIKVAPCTHEIVFGA